jgi:hypothetical protein
MESPVGAVLKAGLWQTAIVALVLQIAQSAEAQDIPPSQRSPIGAIGGNVMVAEPVGEFGNSIDTSWGFSVVGHVNLTRFLRIRGEGGYVEYGSESREICLPDCRIRFDEVTTNSIVFGSVGPELVLPHGPIRPYVHAGIGGSYFATSSHLDGVDDDDDIGDTTNFDDGAFLVTMGGGVYVPLVLGAADVAIDVGIRYHRNGSVRYLREGDIREGPDGGILFTPTQSRAHFVAFTIGMTVGLGRR